jgi:hypothetical protein
MSNNATIVRDMEELQGALLPVATEVAYQNNQNSGVTATASATVIPSVEAVFDYAASLCNEQQQQQQQAEESASDEAVVVPDNANQLNYGGVSDDSKPTVSRAQREGRIRSEEELESIRRANRKVYSQNYRERNSVKSANEWAKLRDREGLQITNDHIEEQLALSEKSKKDSHPPPSAPKKEFEYETKGYQTKEYDCGTYETNDYDISEYKSVYD